ncbi:MAG: YitT family protein [Halarcobacter sp.]
MKEMKSLVFIVVGCFCIAFSTIAFLNPNNLITGGGIGPAQLLHVLFPIFTLGTWIVIVSTPLIIIGFKYFGKFFLIKTLISIGLISVFTDFLKEFLSLPAATHETILASLFGGLLIGLGVGLIILGRASTGGTTIVAEIISAKTKFKTSQIILIIDGATMVAAALVYGDVEQALYSVIGVYITSKIVDMLLSGNPSQKAVSIVTNNVDELSTHIFDSLGEHGTILHGVNLNQNGSKTLILVIVDFPKLQKLKEIVNIYDPDAFLVIQEASELYGRDY